MSKRNYLEELYTVVIDEYGGRVPISEIRSHHKFRFEVSVPGRKPEKRLPEEYQIYQWVGQLRRKYKGQLCAKGVLAFEVINKEIVALEELLTQEERRLIQQRRHRIEMGVARSSIVDNLIFQAKIKKDGIAHKTEIKDVIDASTESLEVVSETAHLTTRILKDYAGEFDPKDS